VNNVTLAYSSEPSCKIAHGIATRFKAEQKFTGKPGEDLTEYISNYIDAANDYNLSAKQRLDYMHLLDGEAKGSIARRYFRHAQLLRKRLT
jgi:hypothetical protein